MNPLSASYTIPLVAILCSTCAVSGGGGVAMDMTTKQLEPFIGAGTVVADAFATGGFALSGSTSSTVFAEDFYGAGSVSVTYTYLEAGEMAISQAH